MKYLLFCLIFFNTNLLGQIKLKDLKGEWKCDNTDSLYYKSDTIKFYQAELYNQTVFNNKMHKILGCHRIEWIVKGKNLKINVQNLCIEPPTNTSYVKFWRIRLKQQTKTTISINHIIGLKGEFEIINYQKIIVAEKEKDFPEEFEKTLILKRIR